MAIYHCSNASKLPLKATKGGTIGMVFQKWTCDHCGGSRQTMPVPNTFYIGGHCEECKKPTDIARKGCGFALVMATDMAMLRKIVDDENRKASMN
jgi:hypothetical protein